MTKTFDTKPPSDARQLALEILLRVDEGAYADLALDAAFIRLPRLDPRDRGLTTELVYGILRHQGRLDFALSRFCKQSFAKIETRLAIILRIGAYQVLQLERIPDSAAVNTAVELTRRIGLERATGFINGILRALIRERDTIPWPDPETEPLKHLVQSLSIPEWLAQRWLRELGAPEALALASALLDAAPFTLRVNSPRISRELLLDAFRAAGHEACPCHFSPDGVILLNRGEGALPGLEEGWFQPQDEASQLISRLLAPQAEERLLDACSAPGGKTTHLATLTGNRASILAMDLHPQRLRLVESGAKRLGCSGIETKDWDLTRSPKFLAPGSFDRILLDAPCSGLGVLRRNPEIRWRRSAADILELAGRQQQILHNLAPLVRPGGTLLYSVCTRTPEETTTMVETFLQTFPGFQCDDLRSAFPQWRELFDTDGALCTAPHRHDGMDAFYAVRFKRTA